MGVFHGHAGRAVRWNYHRCGYAAELRPRHHELECSGAKEGRLGKQLQCGHRPGVEGPGESRGARQTCACRNLGAKAFMVHSESMISQSLMRVFCERRENSQAGGDTTCMLRSIAARRFTVPMSETTSIFQSRPPTWEIKAIEQVIALSRETGCPVHIVHLSAAGALPMIASAKAEGIPITVETCPHYLCLTAEEIQRGETQFKCAPPIREKNRLALWKGLQDGTIDFVVSDHSPTPRSSRNLRPATSWMLGEGISSCSWDSHRWDHGAAAGRLATGS